MEKREEGGEREAGRGREVGSKGEREIRGRGSQNGIPVSTAFRER